MKMNVTKIIEHTRKWTWQIQSQVEPTQNTRMITSKMITIKIFDLTATPSRLLFLNPRRNSRSNYNTVIYPSKNFNWSPQWHKSNVKWGYHSNGNHQHLKVMLNVSSNLGCCQAKPDGLPRIVRQSYAISRRLDMCKHNDTQVRQTNSLTILWNSDHMLWLTP